MRRSFSRTDDESRKQNQSAADESLISDASRLGSLRPRKGELHSYLWDRVPADVVMRFLRSYGTHEDALKVIPKTLCTYVESRLSAEPSELSDWSILLVSNTQAPALNRTTLSGLTVGLIREIPIPGRQRGTQKRKAAALQHPTAHQPKGRVG